MDQSTITRLPSAASGPVARRSMSEDECKRAGIIWIGDAFQTPEQRRSEEASGRDARKAALLDVITSTERALLIAILFALPDKSRDEARRILAAFCDPQLLGEDLSKEVWRLLCGMSFMQGAPDLD